MATLLPEFVLCEGIEGMVERSRGMFGDRTPGDWSFELAKVENEGIFDPTGERIRVFLEELLLHSDAHVQRSSDLSMEKILRPLPLVHLEEFVVILPLDRFQHLPLL